jgi:hypothetical protein
VRSALCMRRRGARVSWSSLKTKGNGFSQIGLKTSGYGFSRFDLKIGGYDFYSLTSKPLARVSRFGHQNRHLQFGDLAHKINTTISWFGPQNQVGYGLSVAPQNRREDKDGAGHKSGSSSLLRLKVSRARVFQSSLKIGGGVAWMVHVASSQRSCQDKTKDGRVDTMGCIGLFYPNFIVLVVLCHKGGLVINFSINRTPRADGEVITSAIPPPHLGLDLTF